MKITNKILALAFMAVAMAFASCSKDGDTNNAPSQKEIETKIVGKWKTYTVDGKECLTNDRAVTTYLDRGKYTLSVSRYVDVVKQHVWVKSEKLSYSVTENVMTKLQWDDAMTTYSNILSIENDNYVEQIFKFCHNSKDIAVNRIYVNKKVTADYSKDIIGLWEGVEMTGYETYGNIEARIEYKADGTYTYYKKVDGEWQPLADVIDEYNVDGDWLATRWQNQGSNVMNYEWWDIDYIKKEGDETIMKWSALREMEDGTRFTTTFTWKKIK